MKAQKDRWWREESRLVAFEALEEMQEDLASLTSSLCGVHQWD